MKHYSIAQIEEISGIERHVIANRFISMGITPIFKIDRTNFYREENIQEMIEGRIHKKEEIYPSKINFE